MFIFWDVEPCSPYVNRRFGGNDHLCLQGRKSADQQVASSITQKMLTFITTAVRTSKTLQYKCLTTFVGLDDKFKKQTPWPGPASELYWRSDRRLSAKLVPTFAGRGRHVVSATDSYGRILGFIDRNRYSFFQVIPQVCSRGWVDPVPDTLLRKSGSAGNRSRSTGSVVRNPDR
jgi:hypothetical protein